MIHYNEFAEGADMIEQCLEALEYDGPLPGDYPDRRAFARACAKFLAPYNYRQEHKDEAVRWHCDDHFRPLAGAVDWVNDLED